MPKADPKTEIRRERFQALCKRKGWFDEAGQKWVVTKIANATLKPTNKVSDLLNGKGSFGAKIARELESALGLDEYELEAADVPEVDGAVVAEEPVGMTYAALRPPTLIEAVGVLGAALAGLDDLGRKMAAPVLANLVENPDQAADMAEQLQAFVEMRTRPPEPPRDPAGSPKSTRKKVTEAARKPPEKARLVVTAGGGQRRQLSLPLRTVANPWNKQEAPPNERAWYERVKAAPKAKT